MATNPTSYDTGYLLALMKMREIQAKGGDKQKQCPICRKGMYEIDGGIIQCENCEHTEKA